jgi:hypothetical protein
MHNAAPQYTVRQFIEESPGKPRSIELSDILPVGGQECKAGRDVKKSALGR